MNESFLRQFERRREAISKGKLFTSKKSVKEYMLSNAKAAIEKFGLHDCSILHRTGKLEIGEASLLIAISSAHREEAFLGGKWLVDEVKRRIPVWKKEVWIDGEEWIEGPEALGLEQVPDSLKNA